MLRAGDGRAAAEAAAWAERPAAATQEQAAAGFCWSCGRPHGRARSWRRRPTRVIELRSRECRTTGAPRARPRASLWRCGGGAKGHYESTRVPSFGQTFLLIKSVLIKKKKKKKKDDNLRLDYSMYMARVYSVL